ncbi:MAG TPA: hypothetical protein VI382_02010, partial [Candidatus Manganitrophaceae bacterium]|nr:hypothetical protein [Candidatus Manganitrophaceae bacterium]
RDQILGTTGEADVGFLAIASKEFDRVMAHINFGYIFIGNPPLEDRADQLRYSLGLEFKTEEELVRLIGEISGGVEVGEAASNGSLNLLGAVSYMADRNVTLDASLGFGLTQDSPDYLFSLGMVSFFD